MRSPVDVTSASGSLSEASASSFRTRATHPSAVSAPTTALATRSGPRSFGAALAAAAVAEAVALGGGAASGGAVRGSLPSRSLQPGREEQGRGYELFRPHRGLVVNARGSGNSSRAPSCDWATVRRMPFDPERAARDVAELAPALREVATNIHENPELRFQETKAAAWIAEAIEREGVAVERALGGLPTAFRARAGRPGRARVAILAEYDALPVIGHACGHNLIAAGALGAFLALARQAGDIAGTVELLGTPAEEGGGGKIRMLERRACSEGGSTRPSCSTRSIAISRRTSRSRTGGCR